MSVAIVNLMVAGVRSVSVIFSNTVSHGGLMVVVDRQNVRRLERI